MSKRLVLLLMVIALEWSLIEFKWKNELVNSGFEVIVLIAYLLLAHFLIAFIIARTKLAQYTGVIVINAVFITLLLYIYFL